MSAPRAESFEVLTKFTTDDVTMDDAMLLIYGNGDPPIYRGAVLIKGGAALRDDPDRLHALVPDDV